MITNRQIASYLTISLALLIFSWELRAQVPTLNLVTENGQLEIESKQFENEEALNLFLKKRQLKHFEEGYLAYSIDSIILGEKGLQTAYEFKGNLYHWGKINWAVSEGVFLKNGLDPSLLSGQIINLKQYLVVYDKILQYYENNGYPFTSLKLDSISQQTDTISGTLRAELGPKVVFDTLLIEGNLSISNGYLKQYLGIQPGDVFSQKTFKSIDKKLKELPFATMVKSSKVKFETNKASITVYLNKKSANFFNGVVGILPNSPQLQNTNGNSNLLITGDVQLILINALKNGEKIDISWKRLKPETQRLKAATAFPYLFNTPFGVDDKLDLFKQDTSFLNFSNQAGLLYALSANNLIKVFWEHKSTNVLSNAKSGEYLQNKSNSYGVEVQLEKLDYRYNPLKGVRFLASAQGGNRNISGEEVDGKVEVELPITDSAVTATALIPATSTLFKFYLTTEVYLPLFKVTTVKLATNNGYVLNPYLFDNDLERIGGFSLLRGFDEQSLYASFYSIFTVEYRLLLERNSFVGLFFDGAFTERNTFTRREKDWPFGFGASISFQTKPGIFSIMYAVGSQKGNPVEFRSAKIHFGFVSLF